MPAQTFILAGPARSGKTTRLLADYRKALATGRPGCALWLGPNRFAVTAIRAQLLAMPLAQCASPQCQTFGQFAQSVLDASTVPLRPLSELMKRHLLRTIIRQGMQAGRLDHFAPIADTPGLLQLVAQTIREWKRLEIWPEELAAACERLGFSQKDRELLWLYDEYQRLLNEHELYDAEGRFWLARALVRDGQRRPFESVQHVFADGFTDFTRTEHEVLSILADRVERMAITLPLETGFRVGGSGIGDPESGSASGLATAAGMRCDLFARPQRTLSELQRRYPHAQVETLKRRATDWPAMDHLEANVFRPPGELTELGDATGIEIVAAAGQLQEIEGLARRIKRLLTRDKEPIAPGDILVVSRALGDVGLLVHEVFDRFGIPTWIDAKQPLRSVSCVSSLVAWLQLVVEDWPFRRLLAILTHNSFQPDWPEWLGGRAAVAVEHLVRELQLPAGRIDLVRRVRSLATPPTDGAEQPASIRRQRRASRARLAAPLLERLSQTLCQLPESAALGDWATALTTFANEVGLRRLIVNSPRDEAAWGLLMKSLRSVERLASWMHGSRHAPRAVAVDAGSDFAALADGTRSVSAALADGTRSVPATLREVLDLIVEIAERENLPPEHDEVGRVRVVDATTARSLSVPFVFFAGLNEQAFPAAEREDRLYGEAETARLVQAGLPLPTKTGHSQDEMLLFYEVLTRSTRHLVLSYPGLDAKAQPLSPSPYLIELERACGEQIPHHREQHLSPVPPDEEVLGERDRRVRAVADAILGRPHLLAGMLQSESESGMAASLIASLRMAHERSHGDGFGSFEGVIYGAAAVERLAARYGAERCWSASQLEQYADCPFRFFAQRELKLEPLSELALDTDVARRGQMLHNSLSTIHRRVNEGAGGPAGLGEQTPEEFQQAAWGVVETLVAHLRGEDQVDNALLEVDRRVIAQWLTHYREQHAKYESIWQDFSKRPRPSHFEVQFGPAGDHADDDEVTVLRDTLGTALPLELRLGDDMLRIRGRIDRIDLGEIAGRLAFNVIDYKSGGRKSLNAKNIASGDTLQLPLYVLAVEQLLLADRNALPWRAGYWRVDDAGFPAKGGFAFSSLGESGVDASAEWSGLRQRLIDLLFSLARGARQGAFPMSCADERCTSRCDFHTVCRVGQARALEKKWQPPEVEE